MSAFFPCTGWFLTNIHSSISLELINLFHDTQFWDRPKFKEAADDNWNVAIKEF